jgi:predicted RNA-binding protein with PUA-like domain
MMRDVRFVARFPAPVTLDMLRAQKALAGMVMLRKGNRLSVTPVTKAEFEAVVKLSKQVS